MKRAMTPKAKIQLGHPLTVIAAENMGIGKKTAQRLNARDVRSSIYFTVSLKSHTFFAIGGHLGHRGEFCPRINDICKQCKSSKYLIVIFVVADYTNPVIWSG